VELHRQINEKVEALKEEGMVDEKRQLSDIKIMREEEKEEEDEKVCVRFCDIVREVVKGEEVEQIENHPMQEEEVI
jgi:hypothetical protein